MKIKFKNSTKLYGPSSINIVTDISAPCCQGMTEAIEMGIITLDRDDSCLALSQEGHYDDGDGHVDIITDYYPIDFCPFCGERSEVEA